MDINITKELSTEPFRLVVPDSTLNLKCRVQGLGNVHIIYSIDMARTLRFRHNNFTSPKIKFKQRLTGIADGNLINNNFKLCCKNSNCHNDFFIIKATIIDVNNPENYAETAGIINVSIDKTSSTIFCGNPIDVIDTLNE